VQRQWEHIEASEEQVKSGGMKEAGCVETLVYPNRVTMMKKAQIAIMDPHFETHPRLQAGSSCEVKIHQI